jgi:hypothetical protein
MTVSEMSRTETDVISSERPQKVRLFLAHTADANRETCSSFGYTTRETAVQQFQGWCTWLRGTGIF